MEVKSLINWLLAGVFFLFAIVQWNDPDPWKWIILYSIIAILIVLYQLGFKTKSIFGIVALLFLGYGLYLSPSVFAWIQNGMPSLMQEMKAETPEIENMRELGGVLICFITAAVYWRKSRQ